ncbi:MAG: NUDIX hydrolase [Verrucomicrobiaceae bacterium]|nr:NUDIX hydrolase [Verrucomicrobiaceae bacterium]
MEPPEIELYTPGTEPGWSLVESTLVFDNPHLHVAQNRYLTPGRQDKPQTWMVAGRKAAVAVAPRLADGRFVLIRQERLPVQQTMWEFPAGQIDAQVVTRDNILSTAHNELREEAGLALDAATGRMTPMGWFFPSQGFTDECVYLLHAEPVCVEGQPEPEGSEHISSVRFVGAGELRRMIAENEITNALSLALFARMAAKGLL